MRRLGAPAMAIPLPPKNRSRQTLRSKASLTGRRFANRPTRSRIVSLLTNEDSYDGLAQMRDLGRHDLAGDASREIRAELYILPPGTALPWHVHPDAQEISYIVEGRIDVEVEGAPMVRLKAGDPFYVAPNTVHRGQNPSATEPVTIYVVRIKPKHRPLVEQVAR
jgi:quercetin dioxygenase-like cupin family protein